MNIDFWRAIHEMMNVLARIVAEQAQVGRIGTARQPRLHGVHVAAYSAFFWKFKCEYFWHWMKIFQHDSESIQGRAISHGITSQPVHVRRPGALQGRHECNFSI